MNIHRVGFPLQGGCLLLGLVLWSLLPWRDCVGAGPLGPFPATASAEGAQLNAPPSTSASQDLTSQLYALKAAIPESQRCIASSIRTAAQMMAEHGIATTRTQMEPLPHISNRGEVDVYLHTSM